MITITDKASKKVTQTIQKRGKGLGIRIGVKTTGCSGLAYVLEYVDTPNDTDIVIIDFVRNGLNEGFEFTNPNERDRCGCGTSFRI